MIGSASYLGYWSVGKKRGQRQQGSVKSELLVTIYSPGMNVCTRLKLNRTDSNHILQNDPSQEKDGPYIPI